MYNDFICKCMMCGKEYFTQYLNIPYCPECLKAMGGGNTQATTQVEMQDLGFGVIREKQTTQPPLKGAISIEQFWEKFDKEHPGWKERGIEQLCDKVRKLEKENTKLKKDKRLYKEAFELVCGKIFVHQWYTNKKTEETIRKENLKAARELIKVLDRNKGVGS